MLINNFTSLIITFFTFIVFFQIPNLNAESSKKNIPASNNNFDNELPRNRAKVSGISSASQSTSNLVTEQPCTIEYVTFSNPKERGIETQLIKAWFCAVQSGNLVTMKELLKNGKIIDVKNRYGQTALMYAVNNNNIHNEIIDLMIKNGAIVNSCDNHGKSALFYAVDKNNLSMIQLLCHYGADVNSKSSTGIAPLSLAACNGNLKIVDFLINQGAEINSRSKRGNTAIDFAAAKLHYDVVKFLIDHHAAINLIDEDHFTPLLWTLQTISKKKSSKSDKLVGFQIVCELINHGADVNATLKNKTTPLILAAYGNNYKIINYLIEHGANVNAVADYNYTALAVSVKFNYLQCAKILLAHGAKVNIKSNTYLCPLLIYAAMHKNLEMYELLLKHGADLNEKDVDGYTISDCLNETISDTKTTASDKRIYNTMLMLLK